MVAALVCRRGAHRARRLPLRPRVGLLLDGWISGPALLIYPSGETRRGETRWRRLTTRRWTPWSRRYLPPLRVPVSVLALTGQREAPSPVDLAREAGRSVFQKKDVGDTLALDAAAAALCLPGRAK